MADKAGDDPLIFVSYRGSDVMWAIEHLYSELAAAFGPASVFKAGNSLRPGDRFDAELVTAARSCPVMLVCIGPGWLHAEAADGSRRLNAADDWVRREISLALTAGNLLVPVLLGNPGEADVPPADLLPADIRTLATRQAVRVTLGTTREFAIRRLVDRLADQVPALGAAQRRAAPEAVAHPPAGASVTLKIGTATGRADIAGARLPEPMAGLAIDMTVDQAADDAHVSGLEVRQPPHPRSET